MTSKKKINSSTKTGFPVHEKANGKKILVFNHENFSPFSQTIPAHFITIPK